MEPLAQTEKPVTIPPEVWKNKKLGLIQNVERTDDILNTSFSGTKNQTVYEFYSSRFSKGSSLSNYSDCQVFQKQWVMPETKRRVELKNYILEVHNSSKFMCSSNPNAVGYFLQDWYTPKSSHKQNFFNSLTRSVNYSKR
eukprot:GFUD01125969.1.p1 GENE.GFUD01125969.1~~GFUD01125969.1.p1  ORF type:complete len:140 (+),score=24.97 GFUD01125969.1:301-720(+)